MALQTKLVAYQVIDSPPAIRPAPLRRSWMDETDQRYAYLCLPIVAANVSGWEILCPAAFAATWDGGSEAGAVKIYADTPHPWVPIGHFGHGILTFTTGYVFRTSPGHNLWVKGPTNNHKDGLAPIEGVVESDWLPYTFTMNYRFTHLLTVGPPGEGNGAKETGSTQDRIMQANSVYEGYSGKL